jgi:hypothetical protein
MRRSTVISTAAGTVAVLACFIAPVAQGAVFNISNGDVAGLIAAITTANTNSQADTINLAAGGLYTLSVVNNTSTGPTGLPTILTDGGNGLTINGNGATIQRSAVAADFRIFLVGGGALTLRQVTLRGGSTESEGGSTDGGAIRVEDGSLALSDSTLTGNRASVENWGFGGGVGVEGGASATIVNCTIAGNTGRYGGGVSAESESSVSASNCTIAGNTADEPSGDPGSSQGGGVWVNDGGSLTLTSCIVADNASTGGDGPDAYGALTSGGNNLVEDPNDFTGTVGSDQTGVDPMLGPLQDNGGPTSTEGIPQQSPAFDKGSNPLSLAGDQRGLPRVFGAAADVGAFEFQSADSIPLLSAPGLFLLVTLLAAVAVMLLRRSF